MCSGSAVLFKIPRVVIGENDNFKGEEEWLEKHGIEVINLQNEDCKSIMAEFIKEHPEDWNEDIGEPDDDK